MGTRHMKSLRVFINSLVMDVLWQLLNSINNDLGYAIISPLYSINSITINGLRK